MLFLCSSRFDMGVEPTPQVGRPNPRAWRAGAFILALLLVGFVVSLLAWRREDSFQISGVPFRMWVAQRPDFSIEDPLASVEQNVVPHLLNILRRRTDPTWVSQSKDWIWKHLPGSLQ